MKKGFLRFVCISMAILLVTSLSACASTSKDKPEGTQKEITPAATTETITLRICSAHTAEGYTWMEGVDKSFIPYVDETLAKTGKYKIEWVKAYGGSLAKHDEVLETVESGMSDLGWGGYVFEASKLPLQNINYHTPFGASNAVQAAKVALQLFKEYPEIPGEYQKYNQTFLGIGMVENYGLFTNFKATGKDDINGKKIGAAGANLAWITGTGGVAVQSPLNDAYTSIQTGVYHGCVQPTGSAFNLKVHEVAPYLLVADFGAIWGGALTINNDTLKKLPEEVRKAFIDGGEKYSIDTAKICQEKYEAALNGIEGDGGTITRLSDEERTKWANSLSNLAMEYGKELDGMNYKGTEIVTSFLKMLEADGVKLARKWYEQ
jgi:TRAP-type C4-dicarboxylate transport system substrate-binding protein